MKKFAKSPLRYPGGKSRAVASILELVPANITEFREPFVGGGSVFLAVKSVFDSAIHRYWVNDLNRDLVCFWRQVRDDVDTLIKAIITIKQAYPDGRELYEYLKIDEHMDTDFQRAVRFFVMNRITFSGVMDAGGYSDQAFHRRFTDSSIECVKAVAPYLKSVEIHHGDYAPLLTAKGENTLIFLDPPYWSATKSRLYGKRGNLHVNFDHEAFAKHMKQCPHRWLITYDDSPYIRELYTFADIIEWELQYGMNNYKQETAAKGKEIFIKNY